MIFVSLMTCRKKNTVVILRGIETNTESFEPIYKVVLNLTKSLEDRKEWAQVWVSRNDSQQNILLATRGTAASAAVKELTLRITAVRTCPPIVF